MDREHKGSTSLILLTKPFNGHDPEPDISFSIVIISHIMLISKSKDIPVPGRGGP
jgi:hypothetical protein